MTNKVGPQISSSWIWWIHLRPAITTLAVGAGLLAAVPVVRSQEEEAPKRPIYTVLYTFTGGTDGAYPNAFGFDTGLTRDKQGNLYGSTSSGGDLNGRCGAQQGCGVVFKLDRAGKETALHTFTGPRDGSSPLGGLVRDEEGNLYDTTQYGGAFGFGAVFKLDCSGKEVALHDFTGGTDGAIPYAGVIRDLAGNLYGTAQYGGAFGSGVVFKLDRTGAETVLYSFTGGADGGDPADLIRDEEGNLYGPVSSGGAFGSGTVFKLDPAGRETVLYSFTGRTDGAQPYGPLVRSKGNLYGTTFFGGDISSTSPLCAGFGCGVVFKLDRAGTESVLHAFTGGADGANPSAGLLWDKEGNFYGTTSSGGAYNRGTVFYGNTFFGGDISAANGFCGGVGCGVVFKLNLDSGKETVLYASTGAADGANPYVGLVADAFGNLFGTTGYGGDITSTNPLCAGYGCGVVFELKNYYNCKGGEECRGNSSPLTQDDD